MHQYYQTLRLLASQASISATEWEWFVNATTVKHIPSGVTIVQSDHEVYHAYFCTNGLFRLYYTLPDGREYNVAFTLENDFATSYGAMISGSTSMYTIQAMEDSTVIEIPYTALQVLMDRSHNWERFVRTAVERLYIRKEERERELLYLTALERYQAFLVKYPGLEKRIPQYHIASYLGISPVSLSRILHSCD
ncbi:Crp/Fnr family transcriptional regulator [Paenibacillus illinoisensis]|uniref:Crp/Fnr family transcriptional regulator n=1 Tax=Paenibacillus illinoisensis TaxID=59845 RepID=UPI001C8DA129|nr:Crp/Fnr family transcriptional regulator [Paenibacillus illinoisensis]MBY0215155.1 Crp/Fnr family transcriptional regulator [Paenibacillus illinoisensis]